MDSTEAKHKELKERLFAIHVQLELHKNSDNKEFLADLKRQLEETRKELAHFKTEQKQRGGK